MKLVHLFPHLSCSGQEYDAFNPISLYTIGAAFDVVEIRMHVRLGAIFIWEEKITLNDTGHTIYRTEYRPEIIRAGDCRLSLFKHLDANSDLYDQFIAEQIHAVRVMLEAK